MPVIGRLAHQASLIFSTIASGSRRFVPNVGTARRKLCISHASALAP